MQRLLHPTRPCLIGLFLFATVTGITAAERPATFEDDGARLPNAAGMEKLAKENPVAFLENVLRRTIREVKGYSLTMEKQENIDKTLHPREICEVQFREKPYSVYMSWSEGARKAERVLYVEGENNSKLLVRPYGRVARLIAGEIVERDPDGAEAKSSGRYSVKEYGFRHTTERTWRIWKAAQDNGKLKVEYLGVQKLKEAGDRPCYVLKRICDPPEADGSTDATMYFDTETWLQVGSVIRNGKNLIGSYYFRDIKLNPDFKDKQFERAALKP